MDIKQKAKKFPLKPGVYRFLDSKGKILYIGRATLLRRRILQYFSKNIDSRISEMVSLARDIKFEQTDNVLDAIILEANLIKKHWPKYNIKDKDDKSFLYIVFTKDKFSYPLLIRGKDLTKFPNPKKIFGPYRNYQLLKKALRILRRVFPYATHKPGTGKPCFDYQIGLCPGTCVNEITQKDYNQNIKNLMLLLGGEKKRLMKKLIKENPDQAQALEKLADFSLITNDDLNSSRFSRIECYDISHFSGKEAYGSMVVFENGQPNNSEYRLFKIKENPGDDLASLKEVLTRRLKHTEWAKPDLIVIDGGRPQIDYLDGVIRHIPYVGISKYGGDRLTFPANTPEAIKIIIRAAKPILLQSREEAHRFANKGRLSRKKT